MQLLLCLPVHQEAALPALLQAAFSTLHDLQMLVWPWPVEEITAENQTADKTRPAALVPGRELADCLPCPPRRLDTTFQLDLLYLDSRDLLPTVSLAPPGNRDGAALTELLARGPLPGPTDLILLILGGCGERLGGLLIDPAPDRELLAAQYQLGPYSQLLQPGGTQSNCFSVLSYWMESPAVPLQVLAVTNGRLTLSVTAYLQVLTALFCLECLAGKDYCLVQLDRAVDPATTLAALCCRVPAKPGREPQQELYLCHAASLRGGGVGVAAGKSHRVSVESFRVN